MQHETQNRKRRTNNNINIEYSRERFKLSTSIYTSNFAASASVSASASLSSSIRLIINERIVYKFIDWINNIQNLISSYKRFMLDVENVLLNQRIIFDQIQK